MDGVVSNAAFCISDNNTDGGLILLPLLRLLPAQPPVPGRTNNSSSNVMAETKLEELPPFMNDKNDMQQTQISSR
jgi:hypothetical protein